MVHDKVLTPSEIAESEECIRKDLQEAWNKLLCEFVAVYEYGDIKDSFQWLKHLLSETVPHGKLNRAVASVAFYRALRPVNVRTSEEDYETYIAGWCIEILQTASLIADDIMDGALTRRGTTCWYRNEKVGLTAINDSFLLENLVYEMIYRYFGHKDYYLTLSRMFQNIVFRTILGQNRDTRLVLDKSFASFDSSSYKTMVKYKTSYYSFYAPIATAMIMAGIKDEVTFKQAEDIMLQVGYYFQVQDDYIDCFGDPEITGKVGTDIRDGKCTWLFVKALEIANYEQKDMLVKCYGIDCPKMELQVKEMYKLIEIPKLYAEFEEETYRHLLIKIRKLPSSIPKHQVRQALNVIYKRVK